MAAHRQLRVDEVLLAGRQQCAIYGHSNQQYPISFDDRLLIGKQTNTVEADIGSCYRVELPRMLAFRFSEAILQS